MGLLQTQILSFDINFKLYFKMSKCKDVLDIVLKLLLKFEHFTNIY